MENVVFLLVAVALYFAADRMLQRIETHLGRRLEHRSLVFFAILLALALVTFSAIQQLAPS
jgi:predicted PurR-regulated permease PerM